LDHDATATEVQHALHSLPTLNEGDVRVETLHSAGSGLCGGDALVIAFTTPLGNQPPLEIISSLLKNGAPGGVIDIQHTTGTRERLECNGAGFCDKAGNITIEFEATAPAPTNGTCACDEGFEWDPDYGSCGRPQFNTSAWTGLQRCPGYVTKDTALDPVDVLNLRYVYIADASNSTADEILAAKRKAGANISSLSVPGGMYTNGAISASRGAAVPSRHRRDSCPSDEVVGGFFSDFGAIRTESRPRCSAQVPWSRRRSAATAPSNGTCGI